jgi:hypothetical protein
VSVALQPLFGYTDIEDFCKRNLPMPPDSILFAGADISSGRKPITFAALDEDLKITIRERWDLPATLSCFDEHENVHLALSLPSKSGQKVYADLKNQISEVGFKPFPEKGYPKQWFETNAQDCYREWNGKKPLPRRSFEGRLQRALTLYERGVRMEDPMEIFEEITRYKLLRGIFRLENFYSSRELDALTSAYLAWISFNRPERIVVQSELVLPAQ